jgi:hypothetical protein
VATIDTFTPRAVVAYAASLGIKTDDKRVRSIARDMLGAYSKLDHPGRQAHEYSAADVATIVARLQRGASADSGESAAQAAERVKLALTPKATPAPKA